MNFLSLVELKKWKLLWLLWLDMDLKQAIAIQADNVNALNSLGSLYYSKGANTMKTDVEKAKVEFKEAKEYLDKLIPLLSADKPAQKKMMDNAKTMLNFIDSQVK